MKTNSDKGFTGHVCPVCWYPDLDYPVEEHNICSCCGTQFGLDGFDFMFRPYTLLRQQWIDNGCKWWFSERTNKDGTISGIPDPREKEEPWPWPPVTRFGFENTVYYLTYTVDSITQNTLNKIISNSSNLDDAKIKFAREISRFINANKNIAPIKKDESIFLRVYCDKNNITLCVLKLYLVFSLSDKEVQSMIENFCKRKIVFSLI